MRTPPKDAHEFLVSSIAQLEDEIDRLDKEMKQPGVGSNAKQNVRNEECPVYLNFESQVEHTFTCRNPDCENVARKSEIFRDFSLEIMEPPAADA